MKFGDRIRHQREILNLTREELSDKLQIKYHTLAKYETNSRQPDFQTLVQIAKILGITTDYILGKTNIKNTLQSTQKEPSLSPEAERLVDKVSSTDPETLAELEQYLNYLESKKI